MCSFIGAQAQVDVKEHGGRNPLVEMAQAIDITGGLSPEQRQLDALRGPRVADRAQDDPRLSPGPEDAANSAGSYEAFVKMMGGGVLPPPPSGEPG